MKRKRNGLFYSKKAETINSISHGIGIAMGVIVSTLFLIKCYQAQNLWAACGVWLYLFGMGGNDQLFGGIGNDFLDGGDGADNLQGGVGNDVMIGGAGADTLSGGSGDDILNGQEGNDILDGGAGSDIFAFGANFGQDRITGFDSNPNGGQDFLDLVLLGINAGNFASSVSITGNNGNTIVTIGTDTITLVGVNSTTVNIGDFYLEMPTTLASNNGNSSLIV